MSDVTAIATVVGLALAFIAAGWVAQDAKKRGMSAGAWSIGEFLGLIIFLPPYGDVVTDEMDHAESKRWWAL
jgi:hypothetical protein